MFRIIRQRDTAHRFTALGDEACSFNVQILDQYRRVAGSALQTVPLKLRQRLASSSLVAGSCAAQSSQTLTQWLRLACSKGGTAKSVKCSEDARNSQRESLR